MKICIYGFGKMGKNHARVLKRLGIEVWIYDINKKLLSEAKKEGYKICNSPKKTLKEMDAVNICVPTSFHKEVFLECVENGVNAIFIEKPLALNSKECDEITKLAKKFKIISMVGYIERFNPVISWVKNRLLPEEFRTLIFQRFGPFPPREIDCGVTLDLATHDIDLSRYLLKKEPKYIFAKEKRKNNFENFVSIILDYGKAISIIVSDWTPKSKRREISVTTDEKNYILDLERQNIYEKLPFIGDYKNWEELMKKSPLKKIKIKKSEPLKHELSHFIYCIKNNIEPLITLEDGTKDVKIAEYALKSASLGKFLKIKF